ncbi:hypothetical protein BU15DRAFT_65607 [Melanogaster broomeanus]|nr:hypothetical protein BU15DRAFT_65607 [Melanogaster broomeanus]
MFPVQAFRAAEVVIEKEFRGGCLSPLGRTACGHSAGGVVTFRDCPEAYHELLKEINDAKNDSETERFEAVARPKAIRGSIEPRVVLMAREPWRGSSPVGTVEYSVYWTISKVSTGSTNAILTSVYFHGNHVPKHIRFEAVRGRRLSHGSIEPRVAREPWRGSSPVGTVEYSVYWTISKVSAAEPHEPPPSHHTHHSATTQPLPSHYRRATEP